MQDDAVILAHQPVAPGELAGAWSFDPLLLAALGASAVVYGRGVHRLGRRGGDGRRRRRITAFSLALAVLAAALVSPLDRLASALFSAHMVQHLLLMIVVAPLLAYARPVTALTLGLPRRARVVTGRALGAVRPPARALWHPVVIGLVNVVVLWAWHMPALYERALDHDAVHAAEHIAFLGASLLFWSVVLGGGRRRTARRPVALLLVFANAVQGTALGAVLVFASTPLYPVHAEGARLWGMSPLADQQLAGALMWVPPGLVYVIVMGVLLFRWFEEMGASEGAGGPRQSLARPLLVGQGDGR